MAKAGYELYRDHFDGLIRKPNGKLRRLTSTCCLRFIFFFFFFEGGGGRVCENLSQNDSPNCLLISCL